MGAALAPISQAQHELEFVEVSAAEGEVVRIPMATATSSGVLSRQPDRESVGAPGRMPFSAAHIRAWAAGEPELISTFADALEAVKVADFLEAPTPAWAERACRLGLASACAPDVRATAAALLDRQTAHVRALFSDVRTALDVATPLRQAMRAPRALHAAAVDARLHSGTHLFFYAPIGDVETYVALRGLDGDLIASATSALVHCSPMEGRGLQVNACYGATLGDAHTLAGRELAAALRALRHVAGCSWLSIDSGHSALSSCVCVQQIQAKGQRDDNSAPRVTAVTGVDKGEWSNADAAAEAPGSTAEHAVDSDGDSSDGEAAAAPAAAVRDAPTAFSLVEIDDFNVSQMSAYAPLRLSEPCRALTNAVADGVMGVLASPLRLQDLTIGDVPFSDAQAVALAAALATQTQLRRLALRTCHMAPLAAKHLLGIAAGLPCLQNLELRNMGCHSLEGAVALLHSVSCFTRLTYLELQGMRYLSNVEPTALANALAPLTALRHLALPQCHLFYSVAGSHAVMYALEGMRRLESLIFDGEVFRMGSATGPAWEGVSAATLTRLTLTRQQLPCAAGAGLRCLARLTSLQHLDLVGELGPDSIEPPAGRALAGALAALPRLTHLNLGAARASAACMRELAPAIGRLSALRELGLDDAFNERGDHVAVAAAFRRHTSGLTALRLLMLDRTSFECTAGGTHALARWLRRMAGLEVLSFMSCAQNGASAAAVCAALPRLAALTYLDLSKQVEVHDHVKRHGMDHFLGADLSALGAALGGLSQLRVLDLGENGIEDDGAQSMARACAGLGELRHFSMAANRLAAAGFRAVGRLALRTRKLERLSVGSQYIASSRNSVLRQDVSTMQTNVKALARVLRAHVAPGQIRIMAQGCQADGEAAARLDGAGNLHWEAIV